MYVYVYVCVCICVYVFIIYKFIIISHMVSEGPRELSIALHAAGAAEWIALSHLLVSPPLD